MTIHPDVAGRPQVLLMLERLIEHISQHDGVRWATMDEIADDFAQRYPRSGEARPVTDAPERRRGLTRTAGAAGCPAAGPSPPRPRSRRGVAAGELQQHARLRARRGRRRRRRPPRRGRGRRRGRTRARRDPRRTASRRRPARPPRPRRGRPATTCSFAFPRPVHSSTIARAPESTAVRRNRASLPACRRIRSTGASSSGTGQRRAPLGPAREQHPLAVDVADRAVAGRCEGADGARVHLAHLARGVDLAGEDDHRAAAVRRR